MKRVIFDIILFISVFVLPWWISAILVFIGIFLFKQFYEFIIVWVIMYGVFSVPDSTRVIANPLWFSLAVGVLFVGIQALRTRMIVYK